MKRKVSAANLSIAITFLLILLSFGFGYRSYSQAEQRAVSDLNQALQRTVLQNKGLWLNADTIQTYAKLQEVMGTPVSVSGSHRAFTEALSVTGLKDVSTLSLHILKKNAPATVFNEIPAGCLASDTLVWLSTTADASGLTLSFRGYARCSAAMLFSLSKQTIPATLLLAALLWGGFTFFYFRRRTRTDADTCNGQQQENTITFDNLSLSLQEACFYNERQEKLKLTPMQYTLMEMFYLSSSHLLFKSDICQSLWPGKDNTDETLYTLIRRLKPIVEDNSNLRITTDRGRAYGLEIRT